jgi:hypothetical protein
MILITGLWEKKNCNCEEKSKYKLEGYQKLSINQRLKLKKCKLRNVSQDKFWKTYSLLGSVRK